MPDPVPPADPFWLLTGDVPTGPFTVGQVHARIAAGDATWQTPACPVGGSTWLPVVRTPGLGPVAPGATAPAGVPAERAAPGPLPPHPSSAGPPAPLAPSPPVPPPAAPAAPPAPAAAKYELVGAAVVLLLIAGGVYGASWVWAQIRPATATEVCKKLDDAKTAAEAKKYATPRMHPLLDALFADKSALDPNDASEWTQEVDGPRPDTKLVGFKGTTFVPEAGRRVRVEGHFVVVKSDGWKADDAVLTGVEGASLPGPVSLVDEHRAALARPQAPAPGAAPTDRSYRQHPPGPSARPPQPVTRVKTKWEDMFDRLRDAVGWGGIVVLGILFAAGAAVRESWRNRSSTTP
ncbi:hypothetical protein [Gemmata sp.]|uniref:hypothetical protein n=1 Tax=Gemmata sp. TaxID=1914242 RepID=UPI003F6F509E